MNEGEKQKVSKFLSYVLRHRPDAIGIELDARGWIDVQVLLDAIHRHGTNLTRPQLEEIVATNDKQRFSFSEDGRYIRANQGHSIDIDLGLADCVPPDLLFHGTAQRFMPSIRKKGLVRGKRRHVHLSPDRATAIKVGRRHGRPVVLIVDAARLHADGHRFYHSLNGVWLTDHVPPEYLREVATPTPPRQSEPPSG